MFLPGIIWARLDARYDPKPDQSNLDFLISAFIYGIATYVVVFLAYSLIDRQFIFIDFKEAQNKSVLTRSIAEEIVAATAAGTMLGVVGVYFSTWKILNRSLQAIKATKRFGDEDVWDYTFNSPGIASQYVNVRDFDKKIVYTGVVRAFSETGKLRELRLDDVKLYDFDGLFMYAVSRVYIARQPADIHIEFPYNEEDAT